MQKKKTATMRESDDVETARHTQPNVRDFGCEHYSHQQRDRLHRILEPQHLDFQGYLQIPPWVSGPETPLSGERARSLALCLVFAFVALCC